MPYTDLAQLTDRYSEETLIELTDRDTPPAGAIDTDVVDRALADTDAMIDGFIAGRYALPLTETPQLLADLAQAIAIYKLHREVASEKITEDYKEAVRQLRDIASGKLRLTGADGSELGASGSTGVRTNDRERDMTPENMKGFV